MGGACPGPLHLRFPTVTLMDASRDFRLSGIEKQESFAKSTPANYTASCSMRNSWSESPNRHFIPARTVRIQISIFSSRFAEHWFSAADFPPDHIDDLVLELEDAEDGREIIRNLTPIEAGWLARAARDKCRRDEELMPEYIERDLNVGTSPLCTLSVFLTQYLITTAYMPAAERTKLPYHRRPGRTNGEASGTA